MDAKIRLLCSQRTQVGASCRDDGSYPRTIIGASIGATRWLAVVGWLLMTITSVSAQDESGRSADGEQRGNQASEQQAADRAPGKSFPGAEARTVGDSQPRSVFDDATQYVPPEELPIVDVPIDTLLRMEASAIREQMRTVSVTRDGKITIEDQPHESEVTSFGELLEELEAKASYRTTDLEGDRDITGESDQRPDLQPRTVIGSDTRTRVQNTQNYPYRTAGRIGIGCTGTLIGPRHVLTAAHCVYNIDTDQWYSELNFSPGQNGVDSKPYGEITWRTAVTTTGWTRDHDRNYDYALIVLNDDIGNRVGWMGYNHDSNLPLYNININGYPADKMPRQLMWHSYGAMKIVQPFRIYHDADTFGGNSGSGMYFYRSSDGSRTIIGVHAYGVDSTGFNGATRINSNVKAKLDSWLSNY
jgi:glutamyl endopeptidase